MTQGRRCVFGLRDLGAFDTAFELALDSFTDGKNRMAIFEPGIFETPAEADGSEEGLLSWFCCSKCQKLFGRESNLKRHVKTHNGERHLCACGVDFARQDILQKHRRSNACVAGTIGVFQSPANRGRRGNVRPGIDVRREKDKLTLAPLGTSTQSPATESPDT